MRYLCLHGMGTNANIFDFQTGPLRHALGTHDEYQFYEGDHDIEPAPGISNLFPHEATKAWYAPSLGSHTHSEAKEFIREIIETEGPFDACIGFSQGAALLASVILDHQEENPFGEGLFKFAVFICGSSGLSVSTTTSGASTPLRSGANSPFSQSATSLTSDDGEWSKIDPVQLKLDGKRIRIPTAHIYGSKDDAYDESLRLRDMCEESGGRRVEFDHRGGHEIPRDRKTTMEMMRVVQRVIGKVMASC
ncbi:uncharacterized protein BDR25DRAFT_14043 [Lindgomyces ingoldianus]|uniref:Uncharacterized protein n=1 Tax=Lindgomyces ingoldianus TaxID=673940 RepID=A0ACB6QZD7_9PLEO|nr:uncharacterized protein BDR25DRAFT_14043 [Lindgomyces ingoldianus]KAF2472398.1 hypothetical protein BDR25DRAFT_14043 [Lindgomyces ingoldianus]